MNKTKKILKNLFNVKEAVTGMSSSNYKSAVDLTVDEMVALVLNDFEKSIGGNVEFDVFKELLEMKGYLNEDDGSLKRFLKEASKFYFEAIVGKEGGRQYVELNEAIRLSGVSKKEMGDLLWEKNMGRLDKDGEIMIEDKTIESGFIKMVKKSDLDNPETFKRFND